MKHHGCVAVHLFIHSKGEGDGDGFHSAKDNRKEQSDWPPLPVMWCYLIASASTHSQQWNAKQQVRLTHSAALCSAEKRRNVFSSSDMFVVISQTSSSAQVSSYCTCNSLRAESSLGPVRSRLLGEELRKSVCVCVCTVAYEELIKSVCVVVVVV